METISLWLTAVKTPEMPMPEPAFVTVAVYVSWSPGNPRSGDTASPIPSEGVSCVLATVLLSSMLAFPSNALA